MSYGDVLKLAQKIADKDKPGKAVSRRKAMELTGMSRHDIAEAVKKNSKIKTGNNQYRLDLLQ